MRYFQSNKYPIELVLSENIEKHFATHNHVGHYVISLVRSGKVEVYKENEKKEYFQGDIFLIPPYVSHSVYQGKCSNLLSLCIGTSFIENYQLSAAECIVQDFMKELYEREIVDKILIEKFLDSVRMIYQSGEKYQIAFEKDIAALVSRMLSQSEQKINIDDLAEDAFISKYYLIRKFKGFVGMTPHQFLIQNRVRKAQRLLNSGKSIIEASVEMGFYDQSHLDKYFLKIVGISPMDYIHSRIVLYQCRCNAFL